MATATGLATDTLRHLTTASREEFYRFGFAAISPLRARHIHELFDRHALDHPDDLAVTEAGGDRLTYGELDERAARLATWLSRQGVRPGDHVGVFTVRGIDWVTALLATLRVGAAAIPQDARMAVRGTLSHIVDVAAISVVLTTSTQEPAVRGLAPKVAAVDQLDLQEVPPRREPCPADPTDTAVVIYTSGTTGVPNGVQVTHANLVNTIVDGPASLGIEPGMRVAQLLNIGFDMAIWEVFGALTHGATLAIRGSDFTETAAAADVVIATPSVLTRLDHERCRDVRIVAVAGERCPEWLAEEWSEHAIFHNSCGPTEVTIVNTVHRLRRGEQLTIGAPIPNTAVYVLDDDLKPVETGELGEMWAGGACVTAGYLGNPQLTADRYRPDPFTGGVMFRCRDLVRWTADGRLEHHGRTDDQVKVRGFRVELDAVTTALERAEGVRAATTLLHEGALLSCILPAGVGTEKVDEVALELAARTQVLADLPYYCEPRWVIVVDELPVTSRGKVDKRSLAALVAETATGVAT